MENGYKVKCRLDNITKKHMLSCNKRMSNDHFIFITCNLFFKISFELFLIQLETVLKSQKYKHRILMTTSNDEDIPQKAVRKNDGTVR